MIQDDEDPPKPGERVLCRHPYDKTKRTYIISSRVEPVHRLVWDGGVTSEIPDLQSARELCRKQIREQRTDHLRRLNPTPYKVSLSEKLFSFMHDLWDKTAAVGEMK
jgi:nicotinate phosphoribosyltransferase